MRARARRPERVKHVREMERVLRFVEAALPAPGLVVAVTHGEMQAAGVVAGVAQTHRGFLQEAVEDGEGGVVVAASGRQDVPVADGIMLDRGALLESAVHPLVEAGALNAAPDRAELGAGRGVELGDGGDARGVEALLHVFADAGEVGEFEVPVAVEEQVVGLDVPGRRASGRRRAGLASPTRDSCGWDVRATPPPVRSRACSTACERSCRERPE